MQLLAEEIGLSREQYIGTFDFAEVESYSRDFVGCCKDGVDICVDVVTELGSGADDVVEHFFFFRLEGQGGNLGLPFLEIF